MKYERKSNGETFTTYKGEEYEWVQIQPDGTLTSLGIGDHYAGCACRLDNRPERCGKESITSCIRTTLLKLPEVEREELIKKLEERYGKESDERIFGNLR